MLTTVEDCDELGYESVRQVDVILVDLSEWRSFWKRRLVEYFEGVFLVPVLAHTERLATAHRHLVAQNAGGKVECVNLLDFSDLREFWFGFRRNAPHHVIKLIVIGHSHQPNSPSSD